jgi:predicted DNA-binding transcriptional regulator AlpA
MRNNRITKQFISENVISTEDVCTILGRSRQWVANAASKGLNNITLKTIVSSNKAILYLIDDVEVFRDNRKMLRPREYKADEDGEFLSFREKRRATEKELAKQRDTDPNKKLREQIRQQILFSNEVEDIIGISRQQIGRAVKHGRLPIIKVTSGVKLFYRDDIEDYLCSHYLPVLESYVNKHFEDSYQDRMEQILKRNGMTATDLEDYYAVYSESSLEQFVRKFYGETGSKLKRHLSVIEERNKKER